MEMPSHPELRRQVENIDFLLHDRQQELDNARELANQNHAIADQKAQTFALLVQDRQSLCRQRAKKDRTIARLCKKVADLSTRFKEPVLPTMQDVTSWECRWRCQVTQS